MAVMRAGGNEICHIGFNQEQDCFAVGTQVGFRIYNTIPFRGQFVRELNGGIGIVEMLFRCNILALVGGGKSPKWPNNKVMIWDDHQLKCIGELSFGGEVKAVKLRKDKVVVVLLMKVYVYNFADLTLIDCLDTCNNPLGLCALNPDQDGDKTAVLAVPSTDKGYVRVRSFQDQKVELVFACHQGSIAAMALNRTGDLLATASEKGTLVRIWRISDYKATCPCFFRRGSDKAEISDLVFSRDSAMIAVSSDKPTIHVFKIDIKNSDNHVNVDEEEEKDPEAKTGFFGRVFGGRGGERSANKFSITTNAKKSCAFSEDCNTMIVVTQDGRYFTQKVDDNGVTGPKEGLPLIAGASSGQGS